MRRGIRFGLLFAGLTFGPLSLSQESRFDSGPYQGFLRSPIEHIIVEVSEPFKVRAVRGIIKDQRGEPLAEAYFELRDGSGQVRTWKTDRLGKFDIPKIPPAIYSFKATKSGFQSIVGSVTVGRFRRKSQIQLRMTVGI